MGRALSLDRPRGQRSFHTKMADYAFEYQAFSKTELCSRFEIEFQALVQRED